MSFNKIIKANADHLKKIEYDAEAEYVDVADIIENIQAIEDADDDSSDSLHLETFASIEAATQCVYGVLKDTANKRITIVFRGSTDLSTRDRQTNFSAQLEDMKTPKLLSDKLEGSL